MKQRLRLILVTIIFQHFITFGQNSPCVNDVSTDPTAPTNANLPNDTLSGVVYDSLFLNHFNWVPFNQFLNLQDLETVGFSHLGSQQAMRPLYLPAVGISGYYQYLRDELIMPAMGVDGFIPNHENEWELLAVNLLLRQ